MEEHHLTIKFRKNSHYNEHQTSNLTEQKPVVYLTIYLSHINES